MNDKPELPCREGFWKWDKEPNLPVPAAREPWPGQAEFTGALAGLQDALLKRQRRADTYRTYRGVSYCRICDHMCGNGEFRHENWIWPEGFIHYVTAHNVRPSLAFQDMVMGRLIK